MVGFIIGLLVGGGAGFLIAAFIGGAAITDAMNQLHDQND